MLHVRNILIPWVNSKLIDTLREKSSRILTRMSPELKKRRIILISQNKTQSSEDKTRNRREERKPQSRKETEKMKKKNYLKIM